MKFLLASVGFMNNNIVYNQQKIITLLKQYANEVDMILFGEAFLQGFYALDFDYSHDQDIAIDIHSQIINEIKNTARDFHIGVSFGFFEKESNHIYSSQITINDKGEIIDIYRRVSTGWKVSKADDHYVEGNDFHSFQFKNKKIAIGICGDLWFENNLHQLKQLNADILFWPIYTDFNIDFWNTSEKYEYAKQVKKIASYTILVNSVCLDKTELNIACGGAALFYNGKILNDVLAGKDDELVIELN